MNTPTSSYAILKAIGEMYLTVPDKVKVLAPKLIK